MGPAHAWASHQARATTVLMETAALGRPIGPALASPLPLGLGRAGLVSWTGLRPARGARRVRGSSGLGGRDASTVGASIVGESSGAAEAEPRRAMASSAVISRRTCDAHCSSWRPSGRPSRSPISRALMDPVLVLHRRLLELSCGTNADAAVAMARRPGMAAAITTPPRSAPRACLRRPNRGSPPSYWFSARAVSSNCSAGCWDGRPRSLPDAAARGGAPGGARRTPPPPPRRVGGPRRRARRSGAAPAASLAVECTPGWSHQALLPSAPRRGHRGERRCACGLRTCQPQRGRCQSGTNC